MVGVPVIINHKDITAKNADDERVGVVNSVWYDDKDGWYWCDGIIWDETAQNLITDQNWSVSCSYDVKTANDEGGSENNIKYDMEFLDGVFTHLALVDNPRYERANIVFNSKTVVVNDAVFESKHPRKPDGTFAEKGYGKYFSNTTTGMSMYDDVLVDKHYAKTKQRFPKIVKMSPDQYIETVLEGFNNAYIKYGNNEYVKTKEQLIESRKSGLDKLREKFGNVQLDMPMIAYEMQEDGTIDMGAQEGLHRAILAKELGLDEIPVAIYSTARYGTKFDDAKIKGALQELTKNFITENNFNYTSYDEFIKEFSEDIENVPDDYEINDAKKAKKDLGVTDNNPRIINTPIESIELRADRIDHIINGGGDGHPPDKKRYLCVNKMLATLERPNVIVKYSNGNKGYFKVFKGTDNNKNQIVAIHNDENGDFVYTAMPADKGTNYFIKQINKGEIIYKKAASAPKNTAVNNIIDDVDTNFNPNVNNHEVNNNKEQEMALLDEIKKLITRVENEKGEDMDDKEKIENEKVDKRKLIDEVGGILKGKVDDELIRTIIGKMEKMSYDESEAGTADNEKDEEEKAENCGKKVKNEDKEDKEEVKEVKEDVKEDVENKCKNSVDNSKTDYFAKLNEIYNSANQAKEVSTYVSRAEREKAAEDYFAR